VPFLALLGPFWADLIDGGTLLAGGHVLMLPAMLGAMLLRRDHYSMDHSEHVG
jgi:flagellar biosynthetic protein FliP